MKITDLIRTILFSLLTFLLGVQTPYAKTELVLPQTQTSLSIESSQKANTLKKEVQPNIGFFFRKCSEEKTKSKVTEAYSTWKQVNIRGEMIDSFNDFN